MMGLPLAHMQTLGQKFRQAREAKGLTVEQIAEDLRINSSYLKSLESDDTSKMPGDFFYRSFIRQYARVLGIPERDYQSEIERSITDQERLLEALPSQVPVRTFDVPPMPTVGGPTRDDTRRWVLRVAGLALVLAATSGVYALWMKYRAWQEASPVVTRPAEPAPQPSAQTPPPAPKTEEPKTEEPKTDQPRLEEKKPAEPAAEAAKPETSSGVRLVIAARETAWLDVWQGEKRIHADILQPGQTKTFEAPDRLRIRLGNAGGVDIDWNGKAMGAPGPRGQVVVMEYTPTAVTPIVLPATPAKK